MSVSFLFIFCFTDRGLHLAQGEEEQDHVHGPGPHPEGIALAQDPGKTQFLVSFLTTTSSRLKQYKSQVWF